jgi:glutamate carboxypeptidase
MRPPLEATPASRALAQQAQRIYREIGLELGVQSSNPGGGTDAAFAALSTRAAVVEGFGLKTFGAHSSDREYVDLRSIEPRLYLLTRMIMEAGR